MLPVIAIVGHSNSGKTTLIEKLLKELSRRGYAVSTVKDVHKQPRFDRKGTDSRRHIEAGSRVAGLHTPEGELVLIHSGGAGFKLSEIGRFIGQSCDLVIAEGFKDCDVAKIEVHRRGNERLANRKQLVAIATDEPLDAEIRQYDLNDIQSIANLLENEFITPNRERVALYINDQYVDLKDFPRQVIRNVALGMGASLKGTGPIKSLDLSIRLGE